MNFRTFVHVSYANGNVHIFVLQEFIFCGIWTAFYVLAASLAADYARYAEAFGAAAVSSIKESLDEF